MVASAGARLAPSLTLVRTRSPSCPANANSRAARRLPARPSLAAFQRGAPNINCQVCPAIVVSFYVTCEAMDLLCVIGLVLPAGVSAHEKKLCAMPTCKKGPAVGPDGAGA